MSLSKAFGRGFDSRRLHHEGFMSSLQPTAWQEKDLDGLLSSAVEAQFSDNHIARSQSFGSAGCVAGRDGSGSRRLARLDGDEAMWR